IRYVTQRVLRGGRNFRRRIDRGQGDRSAEGVGDGVARELVVQVAALLHVELQGRRGGTRARRFAVLDGPLITSRVEDAQRLQGGGGLRALAGAQRARYGD